MTKNPINQKLDELADLYADMLSDPEMYKLDEKKRARTSDLMSSIRAYLIDYPGELIYEKDTDSIKRKLAVIYLLWKAYDDSVHYDEIFGGDNTDFITNFAGGYVKRAKMIRPTFFSVKKNVGKEFEIYFKEAIQSWLYGCKHAAVIICNSLLEDLLRNKLCDIDVDYAHKLYDWRKMRSNPQFGMKELKELASKEKVLPKPLLSKLSRIQQKRNDAVHNLNTLSDEEAYELILDTKDIVEYLLNHK